MPDLQQYGRNQSWLLLTWAEAGLSSARYFVRSLRSRPFDRKALNELGLAINIAKRYARMAGEMDGAACCEQLEDMVWAVRAGGQVLDEAWLDNLAQQIEHAQSFLCRGKGLPEDSTVETCQLSHH